jgi:hypothetical protein
LDADIKGYETVAHLYAPDLGLAKRYTCQMYRDFDNHIIALIPKLQPGDHVILDTIGSLANQTRGDHKLGTDIMASVWDKSEVFFRDKFGQLGYEAAQQQIMRRIRNLLALSEIQAEKGLDPLRITILAHEREQEDPLRPLLKVRGPDINQAFFSALYGTVSDMFRLDVQLEDEVNEETGEVKIPFDTRILYLKRTSEQICKNRCRIDISTKLPRGILNPTLPKLYKVLDRKPTCMVVYSPGGAGKTTFAHSEAEQKYQELQKAKGAKREPAP